MEEIGDQAKAIGKALKAKAVSDLQKPAEKIAELSDKFPQYSQGQRTRELSRQGRDLGELGDV